MRVRFHNGETYDYFKVGKDLYESMILLNSITTAEFSKR
jgi:hypothetical protein